MKKILIITILLIASNVGFGQSKSKSIKQIRSHFKWVNSQKDFGIAELNNEDFMDSLHEIARSTGIKPKKPKKNKKPHIYDIENFDFSFAYTKNFHRNIDIKYDVQKKYRGGFGYNFNARPKPVKPFNKVKLFSKSKWFSLIKDFNFYFLPKNLSVRMDMDRQFNERLYRDKSFGDIITYPTYTRIWNWNRDYNFKYDFSRSLSLEYVAGAKAFIKEPQIYPDKETQEWEEYKQAIWQEIYSFGTMQNFNQSIKINYNVPLKKLPLTDWLKLAAGYQTQYNWTASPTSIQARFGNNIENSRNIQLNGGADMKTLYAKVPYLKKLNRSHSSQRRGTRPTSRIRKKTKKAVNAFVPVFGNILY